NDKGHVLFSGGTPSGNFGLYISNNGGLPSLIFEAPSAGSGYTPFFGAAINNNDAVAFVLEGTEGRVGVFVTDGITTRAVEPLQNPEYRPTGSISINDTGTVAFQATSRSGVSGIFTGPDPVHDTIIEGTGTPFYGDLDNFHASFKLNNNGRLAVALQSGV